MYIHLYMYYYSHMYMYMYTSLKVVSQQRKGNERKGPYDVIIFDLFFSI